MTWRAWSLGWIMAQIVMKLISAVLRMDRLHQSRSRSRLRPRDDIISWSRLAGRAGLDRPRAAGDSRTTRSGLPLRRSRPVVQARGSLIHILMRILQEKKVVESFPNRKSATPQAPTMRNGYRLLKTNEMDFFFYGMHAVREATPEEVARATNILPMKSVWSIKPGKVHKCRGVICGNYQAKDPTEQVWTAQADTASVMTGLRLAQLRNWSIGKLDIKGAFMYAPLPDEMLTIVRPTASWVRMGLIKAGTCWTVMKAVYGLRVSPRAWGKERDSKFAAASWTDGQSTYRLVQCHADTQVWKVIRTSQPPGDGSAPPKGEISPKFLAS